MNNFKSCVPCVCTGSGRKRVCEEHDIIIFRFLSCSDKWANDMKTEIDQVIMQYVHKPNPIENFDMIITHITSIESVTKKQQFQISNGISNYHWIDYINFKKGKRAQRQLYKVQQPFIMVSLITKIEEITFQVLQDYD